MNYMKNHNHSPQDSSEASIKTFHIPGTNWNKKAVVTSVGATLALGLTACGGNVSAENKGGTLDLDTEKIQEAHDELQKANEELAANEGEGTGETVDPGVASEQDFSNSNTEQGDDQIDHAQAPGESLLIPVEERIFITEDGEKLTHDEFVESLQLPTQEYTGPEALTTFFDRIDQLVGHEVTKEEIWHNNGIPTSQEFVKEEELRAAERAYADVYYEALIGTTTGPLVESIEELREYAHRNIAVSRGNQAVDPEAPKYKMNVEFVEVDPADIDPAAGISINAFRVTDNSSQVENVDDEQLTGLWSFSHPSVEGFEKSDFTTNAHWLADPNMQFHEPVETNQ